MKYLLAALLLCASASGAWAQVDFGAQCTPKQRCDALRAAYAKTKPGDTLNVPEGIYADTKFPAFPAGVIVKGAGRGKTIFQSPDYYTEGAATAFELGDGGSVEHLTLQATGPKNRQTIVVGFGTPSDKPRSATIRNCDILDGCWGCYCWQPQVTLTMEDCYVLAARVGITAGASGGGAQTFVLNRNRIKLDASLNTQGGSVTHPEWGGQVGVLVRGGRTTINGLDVEILGPPEGTGPRVAAVTDWLDLSSSTSTVIEVTGLRTKLSLGGAKEKWDIDVRYGTLRLGGSVGSGKGGALTIANLPPLKP